MKKDFHYRLNRIIKIPAQYYVIYGERSNGKTYSVLEYGIEQYLKTGGTMAIVRRWQDDFRGKRGITMFDSLICNGYGENVIKKISGGKWTGTYYYRNQWYLSTTNDDGDIIKDNTPFATAFAITASEHDKSTSYPTITIVVFDEFITRSGYLPDEFILFMNLLSTIIRDRNNVKIFLLGNTINQYCPYFKEMGLKHIRQQKEGTIEIYHYGESDLTVAVEYTGPTPKKAKQSSVYFAFDNPKLKMITEGVWEIDIYPHLPVKYAPKDIIYYYFIQFEEDLLQCEIIQVDNNNFTFIHRKTTPIKHPETSLIFSPTYSALPNHRRKITDTPDALGRKIAWYYNNDKVFYADNDVGEIVRNYILWCVKES